MLNKLADSANPCLALLVTKEGGIGLNSSYPHFTVTVHVCKYTWPGTKYNDLDQSRLWIPNQYNNSSAFVIRNSSFLFCLSLHISDHVSGFFLFKYG